MKNNKFIHSINHIIKKYLSGLSLSIIISVSIVILIYQSFIYKDINKHILMEINRIQKNIKSNYSQVSSIDELKNSLKEDSINVQVKPPTNININKYWNRSIVFKINGYKYLVVIKDSTVMTEIHMIKYGAILLLFCFTFFIVRSIFLYYENYQIKKDLSLWNNKIKSITNDIYSIDNKLSDVLSVIQNTKPHTFKEWEVLYQKSCEFEVLLDSFKHNEPLIKKYDKIKANHDYKFTNYYLKHYPVWQNPEEEHPLFINNILDDVRERNYTNPVYILVFDSMRFDHWIKSKSFFKENFPSYSIEENVAWSLVPTYTSYCRNSLLSGKTPRECAELAYHGNLFNNQYEEQLFHQYLKSNDLSGKYVRYAESKEAFDSLIKSNQNKADITALIYMFIDGLTHSMSKTRSNETLFRDHVLVEMNNAVLIKTLEHIRKNNGTIVITSDHGNVLTKETIRVNQFNISGFDRKEDLSNVPERFLVGQARIKQLRDFKTKNTHLIMNPEEYNLPGGNNTNYAICRGPFKYDTNNKKGIFKYSHGGASITELLVPYVIMTPNKMGLK